MVRPALGLGRDPGDQILVGVEEEEFWNVSGVLLYY
jgi:hypothetical protein